jgi:hypothetical protein
MTSPLARFLMVQVVRYFASTQAFALVVLQGAWMLLAFAAWGQGDTGGAGELATAVLRVFVRLGGVDASGHGDANTLFAVWGKLSLGVYALAAAWRWWRGPRAPWAWWRLVAVSSVVALAGYVFAIWPSSGNQRGDLVLVAVGFAVATAFATAWAVGAARLAERVVEIIERADPASKREAPRPAAADRV